MLSCGVASAVFCRMDTPHCVLLFSVPSSEKHVSVVAFAVAVTRIPAFARYGHYRRQSKLLLPTLADTRGFIASAAGAARRCAVWGGGRVAALGGHDDELELVSCKSMRTDKSAARTLSSLAIVRHASAGCLVSPCGLMSACLIVCDWTQRAATSPSQLSAPAQTSAGFLCDSSVQQPQVMCSQYRNTSTM